MISREHFYKISLSEGSRLHKLPQYIQSCIFIVLFIMQVILFSCKQSSPVSFCEGIDTNGKGINCGKKFTTGDLTAVIKTQERFETESLRVVVSVKTKYKNERVSDFSQKVTADHSTTTVPLSFYIEGDYVVEVFGKNDRILGAGNITVVDTY